MRLHFIGLALLALASCHNPSPAPRNESAEATAGIDAKGVDRTHRGTMAPELVFNDSKGSPVTLKSFRGTPVLVNLWATWCAPCVKELPTLDQLSEARRDGALKVLAINQDMGPHASVVAFLSEHQIRNLGSYQDSKMALSGKLGAEVLPTSILYDGEGREVWRYVGDLDWTGAEAARLLAEAGAAPTS
ncbi:MAG TPA: TlpA disulfide reductase family protein [Sphingomicrobium sp.]|nr:TlpA disulfide reductase family protein [Sphingomicrobium sp.]